MYTLFKLNPNKVYVFLQKGDHRIIMTLLLLLTAPPTLVIL